MRIFILAVIGLRFLALSSSVDGANVMIAESATIDSGAAVAVADRWVDFDVVVSTACRRDLGRPPFLTIASLTRRYVEFWEQQARGLWSTRLIFPPERRDRVYYFY